MNCTGSSGGSRVRGVEVNEGVVRQGAGGYLGRHVEWIGEGGGGVGRAQVNQGVVGHWSGACSTNKCVVATFAHFTSFTRCGIS